MSRSVCVSSGNATRRRDRGALETEGSQGWLDWVAFVWWWWLLLLLLLLLFVLGWDKITCCVSGNRRVDQSTRTDRQTEKHAAQRMWRTEEKQSSERKRQPEKKQLIERKKRKKRNKEDRTDKIPLKTYIKRWDSSKRKTEHQIK